MLVSFLAFFHENQEASQPNTQNLTTFYISFIMRRKFHILPMSIFIWYSRLNADVIENWML